jgi:hypothetical protein
MVIRVIRVIRAIRIIRLIRVTTGLFEAFRVITDTRTLCLTRAVRVIGL